MSAVVLWEPPSERVRTAPVTRFIAQLVERGVLPHGADFRALYDWSIRAQPEFWEEAWRFLELRTSEPYQVVLRSGDAPHRPDWFPGARLNFAQHLLRHAERLGDKPALLFCGEGRVHRTLSWRQLTHEVAAIAAYLRAHGVTPGDRVAGVVANTPEAIVAMLATTALGGIWSSCSPDFGVPGIVDRFGQIAPRVLFASDGYLHKGQWIDIGEKVAQVATALPSLRAHVTIPYDRNGSSARVTSNTDQYEQLLSSHAATSIEYAQLPFRHPLYVMFSSGTTGKPKCIVHSAGGTLLEHLKELVLHVGLTEQDRIIYQTTCGWMMWNWLVSSLAVGATVVLFDGSPLLDDGNVLFDLIDREKVTVFGTNAKYLAEIEKRGLTPRTSHALTSLHTILSTGSPLLPESFDYVYRDVASQVCLSSISGGTDILGCFALGSPTLPVYRGELQTRSLGYHVQVLDDQGQPVVGQKGELVCGLPFPSMPIGFWNDEDDARYQAAYFQRFPGLWHHGDYVELTERGTMVFYGRSDAVLNPGGVRIGTAEIYRVVEQLAEIAESIVIGQEWGGDVRVVLFVRMAEGHVLDDELCTRIKQTVRKQASPFHVPAKIVAVSDIPRTRSGKIVELAVRDVVHGREVKNRDALLNPEALELFRNHPELAV